LYEGVGNINLALCSYKLGGTVGPKAIAIGGDQNIQSKGSNSRQDPQTPKVIMWRPNCIK